MGRLLSAVLMLLLAGVAMADPLQQAQSFAFSLTPPVTDESVAYLGLVFGTVGNVLHGTGGQILGEMFGVFNKGVMVVAAIWLAMTTMQVAIRSAAEGSFMGQNKTVHLVFLRVSLGFALIIPSSATGYSLLQDIFMKVVVSGVALADRTWNEAINYIDYGGQLYIHPSRMSATDASSMVNAFLYGSGSTTTGLPQGYGSNGSLTPVGVAAQIFQNEVCMLRSGSRAWNSGNAVQYSYDMKMDPANGIIYFPGIGNQDDSVSAGTLNTTTSTCGYVKSYCAANAGACAVSSVSGYTGSLDMSSSSFSSNPNANADAEWNYSWQAMKQLVISLLPAAQNYIAQYPVFTDDNYAQNVYPSASYSQTNPDPALTSNANAFFTAILGYGNLVVPLQNLLSNKAGVINVGTTGWISAGGFYWDVEKTNKAAASTNAINLLPAAGAPNLAGGSLPGGSTCTSPSGSACAASELITVAAEALGGSTPSGASYPGYATTIANLWAAYTGAEANSAATNELSHQNSGGLAMEIIMGIIGGMTGSPLGAFGGLNSASLGSGDSYNPIVFIMHEGNTIIEFVATMWTGALVITALLAIVAGICNSTQPAGLVIKTILTWIKSIFMMFTTILLVPGCVFSYYVPMYPFAVFTFAVIGWIMMVVEGMAAAPLICVGVTHPEGHDFLGKGEQALMFFLGIFVRPALLIIGLIASMLVSFVAFQILLAGYGQVWSALPTIWSASLAEIFILFINWIMGLVVFAAFTVEIIEQSYKLTYQLPQYVMKWIGGPEMGQDYGQMATQLKGAVQSGASGVKDGMASMDKANMGAVKGIQQTTDAAAKKKAQDAGQTGQASAD